MKNLHPALAALLSGLLLALSWPNLGGFTPLIFIALIPLLQLADRFLATGKGVAKFFGWSYVALFVWNFIDTYWLFFVEGDFWTRFISAFMPSVINAFLMAIPFSLFYVTKKRLGEIAGLLSLPAYWIIYEYVHLNWDLSWPWLVIGNVFSNQTTWIQWYEFTGHLGGTLWAFLANILFYLALKRVGGTFNWKQFLSPMLFVLLPIAASFLVASQLEQKGKTADIIAVQPNIDQYGEKFSLPFDRQLDIMLEQANSVLTKKTQLVVFPETALQ